MVKKGDRVEVLFQKATPEEIRFRPNTYQLEPETGEVVSDPFLDQYGNEYAMFRRDDGRLKRILTRELKVVRSVDSAPDDAAKGDQEGQPNVRHFGETA